MKHLKLLSVFAAILLLAAGQALAVQCQGGREIEGSSGICWESVEVASNETTLVSDGTVLVADTANAQNSSTYGAYQVRVSTASADGTRVIGVAQNSIVSGAQALVQCRGKATVAHKTTETITSGNAVFVSTSGDVSIVTSTTQDTVGFALETDAASGNSRGTSEMYLDICG